MATELGGLVPPRHSGNGRPDSLRAKPAHRAKLQTVALEDIDSRLYERGDTAFDIFAQIVNELAVPKPLHIKDCIIGKVRDGLPEGKLRTELTRVTKLHWFQYLAGFSNTIKHRQLISHQPSQKYEEGTGEYLGGGAQVAAFKYHSREFKSYWVKEVLEGTVEMHNEIVILGITLNEHCLTPALP